MASQPQLLSVSVLSLRPNSCRTLANRESKMKTSCISPLPLLYISTTINSPKLLLQKSSQSVAFLRETMVSADTFRTVVGSIGNATALVMFLSPVPTFRRIWRSRSVEQFSAAPYLATVINCLFWVLYGLPMVHPHSTLVITISGAGFAIELLFVLVFLFCSHGGQRLCVLLALVAEVAAVGAVGVLVLTLVDGHERRSLIVGVFGVICGIAMYAAPLSALRVVIQTRSVEFMPLYLSLASFLNGVCWTTYAIIRFDLFIIIPNGLGVAFAVAQLLLHMMYHKSTAQQKD